MQPTHTLTPIITYFIVTIINININNTGVVFGGLNVR